MNEQDQELERLAALEHERWSRWHLYAVQNWTPENVERWNRLAEMRYDELPEISKESDRAEVRHYYNAAKEREAKLREEIEKLKETISYLNGPVDRLPEKYRLEAENAKLKAGTDSLREEVRRLNYDNAALLSEKTKAEQLWHDLHKENARLRAMLSASQATVERFAKLAESFKKCKRLKDSDGVCCGCVEKYFDALAESEATRLSDSEGSSAEGMGKDK